MRHKDRRRSGLGANYRHRVAYPFVARIQRLCRHSRGRFTNAFPGRRRHGVLLSPRIDKRIETGIIGTISSDHPCSFGIFRNVQRNRVLGVRGIR